MRYIVSDANLIDVERGCAVEEHRDIIVDGQDGILTQNGDKAGLAAAIIDLLEDDDKRQRFSDQAYQDSERYSEANVMKLWQEIIDDMNEGAAK